MTTKNKKAVLIGGDLRMLYAASAFARSVFAARDVQGEDAAVTVFANTPAGETPPGCRRADSLEEALEGCGAVILPIPLSRDGEHIFAPFHKEGISLTSLARAIKNSRGKNAAPPPVFAGAVKEGASAIFAAEGLELYDYSLCPFFAKENAAYSAEGALAIAIENTSKALADCRVSVSGFGRIGKRLCILLKAAGARQVCVFQRNRRDADAAAMIGCTPVEYGDATSVLPDCDILFNTVPDPSIAALFPLIPRTSLIVELAGIGVKDDNLITALSIPAKYAPESAGVLIYRAVISMQKELAGQSALPPPVPVPTNSSEGGGRQ